MNSILLLLEVLTMVLYAFKFILCHRQLKSPQAVQEEQILSSYS